jgi:hypothetical protein
MRVGMAAYQHSGWYHGQRLALIDPSFNVLFNFKRRPTKTDKAKQGGRAVWAEGREERADVRPSRNIQVIKRRLVHLEWSLTSVR